MNFWEAVKAMDKGHIVRMVVNPKRYYRMGNDGETYVSRYIDKSLARNVGCDPDKWHNATFFTSHIVGDWCICDKEVETTLTQLKKTLDELSINVKYEGDQIEFTTYGKILCHDIEDEDIPEMIRIFNESGCWPEINVYNAQYETPHPNICKDKLELLNNDYAALWDWIKSIVKAVG